MAHPGQAVMKTLTDITAYTEYVEKLNALFENEAEDDVEEATKNYPVYTAEDFLERSIHAGRRSIPDWSES